MYANQVPQQQPGRALDAPTPATFHGGIQRACERLASLSSNYESLIQRLNGPRPVGAGTESKEQREPSTSDFMQIAHKLLSELESQFQELASTIG